MSGATSQFFLNLPFGETMIDHFANIPVYTSPYKFNGKELDDGTGMYYYGARYYDPRISVWMSVDPLAEKRSWVSPYNYCLNNPISNIDISGALDEPVFGSNGIFKGTTKEGYSGTVLIYDGKIDFSKMSKNELLSKGASTYDMKRGSLTNDAKSRIWTNIASHYEGLQVYDEKFTMNDLQYKKIAFNEARGGWSSKWQLGSGKGKISGSDRYSYETTVENIASSIIVHEWYSHIEKGNRDDMKSHRLAYKNVINFKYFWNNTTDSYKGFNVNRLSDYTLKESNEVKSQVDKLYRRLYNKYSNYSW